MISFHKLVVTNIRQPTIVHSQKGKFFKAENRQSFGLSFCICGQITYTMNGKKYVSNQNNAILLPQGGTYTLVGDSEGQFPVINFSGTGLDCKEITVLPLEGPQACIQRIMLLQQLFLRNESPMKIYSTFYDLLDHIAFPGKQDADRLTVAIKYIEDHIQDPALSNTELAKHIGISEVYLRKQFQATWHVTPKQYILDARIRKAKQLLIDTPLSINAVAEKCGFSSVYHFCRSFKQRTGKTPTLYATENKTYQI